MPWIALDQMLVRSDDSRPHAYGPVSTHADFARLSLAAAGALRARGTRRAGLWFEDAAQLAIALYACWRADVVAVLPGDVRAATCEMLDPDLDGWIGDVAGLPVRPGRYQKLESLYDAAPALPAQPLDLDAAGLELCTSGSSGKPKRIAKRWRQLAAEIDALERQWRLAHQPANVLGSVSPQHMYGLPFRVLWPLCAGCAIERQQLVYPEDLQRATLLHTACVWIGSPALLKRLGDHMDWPALAARVRRIFSSGGPLPLHTSDAIADALGSRPVEIYGSSETGAAAWRQGSDAWKPLPSVRIGLDDAGALWVRSPWIADDIEQTADAAELAGDGFHLLGRLDRIVKIEEKRIALPSLEEDLARHPWVREARLGRAAPAQRLTALVALNDAGIHALRNGGRKGLAQALRAHIAASAEPVAVPRRWRFLRELPWNAQGKLPQHEFEAASHRPLSPRVQSIDVTPAATGQAGDATAACRLHLEIPLDLAHFDGHFPAAPVVPGIAQIGWAMAFAREHIDPDLGFHGMEMLKFQHLMRPGDAVELTLRWEKARGRLYFDYRLAEAPCATGRILVRAKEPAT